MYSKYFPDYDDTLPCIDGFIDASYGNDTCPSLFNEQIGLFVHCDYADETKRETGSGSFKFNVSTEDGVYLFGSDFIDDIRQFINEYELPMLCRNGKAIDKCFCC